MRPRWVDRNLGIWELLATRWLIIDGTTPRNAELWTVSVAISVASWTTGGQVAIGRHWGYDVFLHSEKRRKSWGSWWNHRPRGCACYGCRLTRTPPLTSEGAEVLREVLRRRNQGDPG